MVIRIGQASLLGQPIMKVHQAWLVDEGVVTHDKPGKVDCKKAVAACNRRGFFLGKSFLHPRQYLGAVTKTLPIWRNVLETTNNLNIAHVPAHTGAGPSLTVVVKAKRTRSEATRAHFS
jgi:hypothetical protein